MRSAMAALCALAPLVGCGHDSGGSGPNPTVYQGPPVHTELVAGEAGARAVSLWLEVPSGGYSLSHDETLEVDDGVAVRLTLASPAEDEETAQVLQTLRRQIEVPGRSGPVRVEVKCVQRGAQYFVTPPYLLAATAGGR